MVGVVPSRHVTKITATLFDPAWPETPCYTQILRLSLIGPGLLPVKVLHCGNEEIRVFLCKEIVEILKFLVRTAKLMQMMPKRIFCPLSTVLACFATRVTCGQNVVLRRNDGCGHFRSRDKDGGHTIRSAIALKPPAGRNYYYSLLRH